MSIFPHCQELTQEKYHVSNLQRRNYRKPARIDEAAQKTLDAAKMMETVEGVKRPWIL